MGKKTAKPSSKKPAASERASIAKSTSKQADKHVQVLIQSLNTPEALLPELKEYRKNEGQLGLDGICIGSA